MDEVECLSLTGKSHELSRVFVGFRGSFLDKIFSFFFLNQIFFV